jgi:hypothetical protein
MRKPVDNPPRKRARTTTEWVHLIRLVVLVAVAVVLPTGQFCGSTWEDAPPIGPAGL